MRSLTKTIMRLGLPRTWEEMLWKFFLSVHHSSMTDLNLWTFLLLWIMEQVIKSILIFESMGVVYVTSDIYNVESYYYCFLSIPYRTNS